MEKKDITVMQMVFTALGSLVGIFFVLIGGVGFIGEVLGLFGFGTGSYSGENSVLFYIWVLGMELTWAVMGAWFLKALFGRDYGKIPRIILAFVGIHIMLVALLFMGGGIGASFSEGISMYKIFILSYLLLWFVLGGTLLYVSRAKKLSLRSFMPFWIMLVVVLIVHVLLFLIAGDNPIARSLQSLFS